jgi:hypothetical protein
LGGRSSSNSSIRRLGCIARQTVIWTSTSRWPCSGFGASERRTSMVSALLPPARTKKPAPAKWAATSARTSGDVVRIRTGRSARFRYRQIGGTPLAGARRLRKGGGGLAVTGMDERKELVAAGYDDVAEEYARLERPGQAWPRLRVYQSRVPRVSHEIAAKATRWEDPKLRRRPVATHRKEAVWTKSAQRHTWPRSNLV